MELQMDSKSFGYGEKLDHGHGHPHYIVPRNLDSPRNTQDLQNASFA